VIPIYIFSLPRSGSTLLQRILASHTAIETAPEPWIALPVFLAPKPDDICATYDHSRASHAIKDVVESLPNGIADFRFEAAQFLRQIYRKTSTTSAHYFLDKTPRYHLIAEDLIEAFPDAKFIFVWRNPLAIVASMMDTWSAGKWNLHLFSIDLYRGLENLIEAYTKYEDRVVSIRYEDIVAEPTESIEQLSEYLSLPDLGEVFSALRSLGTIDAPGRGDPTGQYKYKHVSQESLNTWKTTLANPVRKRWAKQYIDWIGEANLQLMGYSLNDIQSELRAAPLRLQYTASDILRRAYGKRRLIGGTQSPDSRYRGIRFRRN